MAEAQGLINRCHASLEKGDELMARQKLALNLVFTRLIQDFEDKYIQKQDKMRDKLARLAEQLNNLLGVVDEKEQEMREISDGLAQLIQDLS